MLDLAELVDAVEKAAVGMRANVLLTIGWLKKCSGANLILSSGDARWLPGQAVLDLRAMVGSRLR